METASPEEHAITPEGIGDDPGTSISVDDLKQAYTRDAHAAWHGARGTRRMPSRADMTPRVMRKFLSYVALAELVDGGKDFRFRVVGDGIAHKQKLLLIGKTLADVDHLVPDFGTFLRNLYLRTVRQRDALAYRGTYVRTADRHPFTYEAVILPLGDDGETPDHVLVVSV
ncbi:MAG: PAS domain-containing protein [Proteobacteria bacterium]|nr:PAS domain-containing protein [Pseudomonadota bacterium]